MLLRLAGFTGMWPARDVRALPDNAAAYAQNVRADGGQYLKGQRAHTLVIPLGGTPTKVYPIKQGAVFAFNTAYWMKFIDINTDVVQAPIVNDSFKRYYWASPSTGLKYASEADIIGGSTGFTAGVPAPTAAPTLNVVSGTGTTDTPIVTRSYVYTHVNIYGEESQPSLPVEGTGHTDQDWLLTNMVDPVAPGYAGFLKKNIYRTVLAADGVTNFFKVTEILIGTTFYTDRLSDLAVTSNKQLETVAFATPPPIDGIVALPNGIFLGWKGKDVYVSENYHPHAWPVEYKLTVDHPIVGMGVFGNSVVVCTEGAPSIVSGSQAAALTLTKTGTPLACLSRQSIVEAPEGVYYASSEGLVLIGPQGINIVTLDLITPEQWLVDYKPQMILAMYTDGEYVAQYASVGVGEVSGFKFSPRDPSKAGVTWTFWPSAIVNVDVEPWTGKPYMVGFHATYPTQYVIYEWEKANASTYTWRSKEIRTPFPTNFAVFMAYFDSYNGGLTVNVYAGIRSADGTLVSRQLIYGQGVNISGIEVRLPSGFKSDLWEVELVGTADLQEFVMASSIAELRGV